MLPLVITVEQIDGGTRRYAFADSPVSIGRSPFTELQLSEPFISRWEGTLRFDADEITYFSLGSTNATYVNGEPLAQREDDIPLSVDSVLTLGDLKLRFSREPVPECDLRRKGKPRPTLENTATGLKTQYLDAAIWAKLVPARAASAAAATGAPAAASREANGAPFAAVPAQRAATIAPQSCIVVGAEALARRRTLSGPTLLELDPAAAQPAHALEPLAKPSPPAAPGPTGVADSAASFSRAGDIPELRDWMRAISPEIVPEGLPFDSQLALTRVLGLLEVLIQSLAEIHDAQESVRRRWLGRSARRSILQSEDGNTVLAYLLDPRADWNDRSSELEQSVRDVVTHELALFRATLDGARTLVSSLAPDVIASSAADEDAADAEPAPGFWTRLLCKDAGEIGLWRRFLALYGVLTDGARYERVFFGRVFSRSYRAAMGQGGAAPARS
jgi:pSer/pThr/pTyr-binding forkhead associated (FHA) protein